VDDDGADLAFLLPDLFPRLAGVARLVDAVARGDVAADVGLAGTDVDHVRVGRGDGDGPDRRDGLVVEDGLPGEAAVGRLPDAAAGGGRVIGERVAWDAAGAADAAADGGADQAVLELLELGRAAGLGVLVFVVGVGRPGQQGQEQGRQEQEQTGSWGRHGRRVRVVGKGPRRGADVGRARCLLTQGGRVRRPWVSAGSDELVRRALQGAARGRAPEDGRLDLLGQGEVLV